MKKSQKITILIFLIIIWGVVFTTISVKFDTMLSPGIGKGDLLVFITAIAIIVTLWAYYSIKESKSS